MATKPKTSLDKGKGTLTTPLHERVPHKGKEGLGYVAKEKKKIKKKTKPTQAKKDDIASGNATRGTPTRDDFAGISNPNYALYVDYYGDVYARYIGPFDGYMNMLFGFQRPLLLTKRHPLQNGYRNPRNDCV